MITEGMRFKTEEELVKEFGEDWRPKMNWVPMMDKMLGRNLTEFIILDRSKVYEESHRDRFVVVEDRLEGGLVFLGNGECVRGWYIDKRTMTPIEYPKKIHCKYRIKTREEFEKEFGENWRHRAYGFVPAMDGVLGEEIPDEISKEILEQKHNVPWNGNGKTEGLSFHYGIEMITKCDNTEDKEEKKTEKENKESNKDMEKTEVVDNSVKMCRILSNAGIQKVYFNEKNKTVTVLLHNGTVGLSTCSSDDQYDHRTGFCVALANALCGSKKAVDSIVKHFNGEEAKELREKEMRKKILAERKLAEYKKKAEAGKKKRAQKEQEEKKFRAEVEKKMLEEERTLREARSKKKKEEETEKSNK